MVHNEVEKTYRGLLEFTRELWYNSNCFSSWSSLYNTPEVFDPLNTFVSDIIANPSHFLTPLCTTLEIFRFISPNIPSDNPLSFALASQVAWHLARYKIARSCCTRIDLIFIVVNTLLSPGRESFPKESAHTLQILDSRRKLSS